MTKKNSTKKKSTKKVAKKATKKKTTKKVAKKRNPQTLTKSQIALLEEALQPTHLTIIDWGDVNELIKIADIVKAKRNDLRFKEEDGYKGWWFDYDGKNADYVILKEVQILAGRIKRKLKSKAGDAKRGSA